MSAPTTGEAFADGFGRGSENQHDRVRDAAASLAEAAKDTLKIESPTSRLADILAAHEPERDIRRPISVEVAQQMLYLLGDNEAWSRRPDTEQMRVWAGLRHENVSVRAEIAVLFPEQAEALRVAYKSWGLDALRKIVAEAGQ